MAWDEKNGDSHENDVVCVAFGAALLLSASTVAVNAMGGGSCHLRKTCAVDLDSLCAGVAVGEGRLPTCLKAHMANLSSSCSAKLSREVYVATTCEADVKRFCGNAMSGGDSIASCMQTHLGQVSKSCKSALVYIDALPSNYP